MSRSDHPEFAAALRITLKQCENPAQEQLSDPQCTSNPECIGLTSQECDERSLAAEARYKAYGAEVTKSCIDLYGWEPGTNYTDPRNHHAAECIQACQIVSSHPTPAMQCVGDYDQERQYREKSMHESMNLAASLFFIVVILGALVWYAVRAAKQ